MFFNPILDQNKENGFILLEENIRHLKNCIHSERFKSHKIDLSEFLNVNSLINNLNNAEKNVVSEEKFCCNDEDINFTLIENYFK